MTPTRRPVQGETDRGERALRIAAAVTLTGLVGFAGVDAGWAIVALAFPWAFRWGFGAPTEEPSSHAAAAMADGLIDLLPVARGPLFVLCVGGWVRWSYVAHRNLRDAGRTPMHSPDFAAICWFIPLGNLFLPYVTTWEAWRLSAPLEPSSIRDQTRGVASAPFWLPLWWVAWIFLLMATRLFAGSNQGGLVLWRSGFGLTAALLAGHVIVRLTRRQVAMLGGAGTSRPATF